MNTAFLSKSAGAIASLLFATLFTSTAIAGSASNSASGVFNAQSDAATAKLCAGAEVVGTTVYRPMMPNGKGPLLPVQVGTRTICHMCPVTTLSTKTAFGNGKGPMTVTKETKVGPEHDCANCTGTPAKT